MATAHIYSVFDEELGTLSRRIAEMGGMAEQMVSDSIRVLLQAVPKGLDARAAELALAELDEVDEAEHFHAWTLTDDTVVATVHVTPATGADTLSLPRIVADSLKKKYDIDHVTVTCPFISMGRSQSRSLDKCSFSSSIAIRFSKLDFTKSVYLFSVISSGLIIFIGAKFVLVI